MYNNCGTKIYLGRLVNLKIFVSGIHMEANSFSPIQATLDAFDQFIGEEIETLRGTELEVGGFYEYLDRCSDVEVIPGYYSSTVPAGPAKDEDFKYMAECIFGNLKKAGKVDGVLLSLHGAMASDKVFDCEGYILENVRKIVGEDVPICASLDFHTLLTQQMMDGLDGMAGYLTYPHVDRADTGFRAAQCLLRLIHDGTDRKKIKKIYKNIPLIMPCENSNTFDSPMVYALNRYKELLAAEGVLSAGMFMTQPWLDAPDLGFQVAVFFENEKKRAEFEERANEIISYVWDNREKFYTDMPGIPEALEIAKGMEKPMCFVDFGDVPNAGSTGDGVAVLKVFLDAKLDFKSCVIVADKESVKKAVELGVGAKGEFMIGGFGRPGDFNERIAVEAEVLKLNPETYVSLGPAGKGIVINAGMRALLCSGKVYIILCEKVCISHDSNMLISMGIDPCEMGIISMRATHSFISTYGDIIKSWLYVDTPGYSTRNHKTLSYKYCRRPIYPLDNFEYSI